MATAHTHVTQNILSSPKIKEMLAIAADAVDKDQDNGEAKTQEAAAATAATSSDAVTTAVAELDAEAKETPSELRQVVEDKVWTFVNSAMVVLTIKKILGVLKRPATGSFVGIVAKQIEAQGQLDLCACRVGADGRC